MVGRYTASTIFAAISSTVNTSALTCTENTPHALWVLEGDKGTDVLLNLTDYDSAKDALRMVGNRTCFLEGLDERNGTQMTADGCPCATDWFGAACSIPGFIDRSPTPWSKDSLRVRSRPRRVINAFPFNVEFEMAELRFAELADVVDVFLILESNYTAFGRPKPLYLLDRLRKRKYRTVVGKVIHIFLDYFPSDGYRDGWVADAEHRNYLGTHGLRRLAGLRPDDLVVLTDADELPRRQLLSFLKWHDGYTEPVILNYRWSVYRFFWGVPASNGDIKTQRCSAVVTMAMVIYVFRYQIYFIRNAPSFIDKHAFDVQVCDANSIVK